MKPLYAFWFVALTAISCASRSTAGGVIQKDEMVAVMGEVYQAEMHYQKSFGTPAAYKPHLDKALLTIFKKHGISRKQYETSFSYYAARPATFMEMNERIIQQYNNELIQK